MHDCVSVFQWDIFERLKANLLSEVVVNKKNTLVTKPGPLKATGDAANLAEEPGTSSVYVQPNYNNVNDDDLFYVHYQKQVWPHKCSSFLFTFAW